MTDAERHAAICDQLRIEIEALCDDRPVLYSRSACTPRRTVHTTIVNGWSKKEFECAMVRRPLLEMASSAVTHARELREKIPGPAYLVWRVEPEINEAGDLYMRLCFEAV